MQPQQPLRKPAYRWFAGHNGDQQNHQADCRLHILNRRIRTFKRFYYPCKSSGFYNVFLHNQKIAKTFAEPNSRCQVAPYLLTNTNGSYA